MAQPEFLLYSRYRKPARVFQASELEVAYPEIRKVTYSNIGGFRFGHSTGTGRYDRRRIYITSPQVRSYVFRVLRTGQAVKSVLRRLRAHEADQLDALDAQINALEAELASLRERRTAILHAAWQRGNVVRLNEVEALLDRPSRDTAG